MGNYLKQIYKISSANYQTLKETGSLTYNGKTYKYDPNNLYLIENNLTDDYVLTGGGGSKLISELSVKHADSADSADTATTAETATKAAEANKATIAEYSKYMYSGNFSPNTDNPVWHNRGINGTKPELNLDKSFTYNPSTDTLKVPNIEGTITEAKKVTNKLTAGSKTYDGSAAVSLTKADLGLGNVDNTSDKDKVIYNNKLSWSGDVVSGSVTPLGVACVPELSANRVAFLSPKAVTIEYSRDAGETWQETQYGDDYKILFCTALTTIYLGCPVNSSETNKYNPGLTGRTRITIFAQPYFYTLPKKILINTSGPDGLNVLIEKKQGTDGANWTTVIDAPISGWSGWSDISVPNFGTLGGSTTQTTNNWYIRFTFYRTTDANLGHSIRGIKIIGENSWTSASMNTNKGPMSSTGHLYDYDINANAIFPAQVKASSLYSTGVIQTDAYIYAKQDMYENGVALSQRYVQQVSGKQLSTNDYTTAEKNKLAGLSNAEALTNSEIDEAIK